MPKVIAQGQVDIMLSFNDIATDWTTVSTCLFIYENENLQEYTKIACMSTLSRIGFLARNDVL